MLAEPLGLARVKQLQYVLTTFKICKSISCVAFMNGKELSW